MKSTDLEKQLREHDRKIIKMYEQGVPAKEIANALKNEDGTLAGSVYWVNVTLRKYGLSKTHVFQYCKKLAKSNVNLDYKAKKTETSWKDLSTEKQNELTLELVPKYMEEAKKRYDELFNDTEESDSEIHGVAFSVLSDHCNKTVKVIEDKMMHIRYVLETHPETVSSSLKDTLENAMKILEAEKTFWANNTQNLVDALTEGVRSGEYVVVNVRVLDENYQ